MIPALSAQMMNRPGSGVRPGWLPDGAIDHLDFIDGNYFAGGAARDVSALLGGGFNPADISSAGMFVAYEPYSTNRPNAIGVLFNDLVLALGAGCTIIFDIDFGYTPYGRTIDFLDAVNERTSTEYIAAALSGDTYLMDQGDLWLQWTSLSGPGRRKIGKTFARHIGGNYEYAISVNGSAAVTQALAYPPMSNVQTITLFHDGGDNRYVLDNSHVRSMTLYPAITPAQLAALTA